MQARAGVMDELIQSGTLEDFTSDKTQLDRELSQMASQTQVQSELEAIHQRTPDREIAVKGDKLVKYGDVLDVLKACREVGFNDVGLIAQPKKTPGQGT